MARAEVIHVKVGSEKSQILLLGLRCGGSAHARIPRELQQQRGHLDVV